jgi:hypothetical protein
MAPFRTQDFFLFSTFSCEIELNHIKIIHNSYEIPVFQREPIYGL